MVRAASCSRPAERTARSSSRRQHTGFTLPGVRIGGASSASRRSPDRRKLSPEARFGRFLARRSEEGVEASPDWRPRVACPGYLARVADLEDEANLPRPVLYAGGRTRRDARGENTPSLS